MDFLSKARLWQVSILMPFGHVSQVVAVLAIWYIAFSINLVRA